MLATSMPSFNKSSSAATSSQQELLENGSLLGFAGGDTNLTRYVGNNPTNATDPSGLELVYTNPAPQGTPPGGTAPPRQNSGPVASATKGDSSVESALLTIIENTPVSSPSPPLSLTPDIGQPAPASA